MRMARHAAHVRGVCVIPLGAVAVIIRTAMTDLADAVIAGWITNAVNVVSLLGAGGTAVDEGYRCAVYLLRDQGAVLVIHVVNAVAFRAVWLPITFDIVVCMLGMAFSTQCNNI